MGMNIKRNRKDRRNNNYNNNNWHNQRHTHSHSHSREHGYRHGHSHSSSSGSSTANTKGKHIHKEKDLRDDRYKKLVTTRNLLLTGRFKFDTMSEEAISFEIKQCFGDNILEIEYWKYCIEYSTTIYNKHLNCISITFKTSQLCADYFSKFV